MTEEHERRTALTALLREAAAGHHEAFAAVDGADPDWPLWYAEFLHSRLGALLERSLTRADVVRLLMNCEDIRAAEAPDAEWAPWTAERLLLADGRHDVPPGSPGVTGLGGVFFKARDPDRLRAWYRDQLGVPVGEDGSVMFRWRAADDGAEDGVTVWGPFDETTDYFEPSEKPFMINFRVAALDVLLERLRAAGVTVDERVDDYPYGRFGWCMDPEGNRIELWEPR